MHGRGSLAVAFSTVIDGRLFLLRIASFVAVVPFLILSLQRPCSAVTPSGSLIQNTATITFAGAGNVSYASVSNTISVTVAAVAALVVTPKQNASNSPSAAFVVGATSTELFTITNTGNLPTTYVVQSATVSAGSVMSVAYLSASGSVTPVVFGQTVSPTVAPGQTQNVQVTLSTQNLALGTRVTVTLVAGTAGTVSASDTGTIVGVVAAGAAWGAPGSSTSGAGGTPNEAPVSLVNGSASVQVQPGATVTYTLAFENYGGVAATDVQLLDNVPAGITPAANSVTLNGAPVAGVRLTSQTLNSQQHSGPALSASQTRQTLSGQVLVIPIGTVPPLVPQLVTFTGTLNASDALGVSYINSVTLQADNLAPLVTESTSVFVGAASTMYDGTVGPGKTIVGASISLVNATSGAPLSLDGTAIAPNTQNTNPFVTVSGGQYAFGLGTDQVGNAGASVTYDILISASGYLNRKIQATLTPDTSDAYYSVTLKALDGQALAVAGGYALSTVPVTINGIYGMLGNFPLFTPNLVTIAESVDRSSASGGDRVVFTLNFSGNASTTLNQTQVVDTLPVGMVYAPGTGRLDAVAAEPTVNGRILTWTLPTLNSTHTIMYATVVMPTATPGTTLINMASISAALPFGQNNIASASTTCDVQITAGIFSDRIIITGRVFADVKGTGHFVRGDRGVGGVRIYLEDGESVVTDQNGRFTFPAARPGMHVMRLDVLTLPKGVSAYADRRYDSERSVRRLVHGIFDSGLMQDVNFAMRAAP